jgi:hypothetical protein
MLLRRVRRRAGRRGLVCIGTSATIVTKGDRAKRRARIAEVGQKLFGVEVPRDNVVEETLQRVATVPVPEGRDALAAAARAEPPPPEREAVRSHPLAAWVEATFGLTTEYGRLVRGMPLAFEEGVARLVEATGLDPELCRARLRAVLEAGNAAEMPTGELVFAFRLHQFLASGGSVYATIEAPAVRALPGRAGTGGRRGAAGAALAVAQRARRRDPGRAAVLHARARCALG